MLKKRVATAIALALFFSLSLFYLPAKGFFIVMGLVLAIAVWEWSSLSGLRSLVARLAYVLVVLVLGLVAAIWTEWSENSERLRSILIISCTWWALALLWVQGFPSSSVIWGGRPARLFMGSLVLVPAWLGLIYLRSEGVWWVFALVIIVAASDIGAFFAGRAFGKYKLAPHVSPGKSWEGVIGGTALAVILALVFNVALGGEGWLGLLVIVIPTSLITVLGDLLESMVKRHRGVKDSGQLLPGHGGVLDRIDGLTAAIPVFSLALMASQWRL